MGYVYYVNNVASGGRFFIFVFPSFSPAEGYWIKQAAHELKLNYFTSFVSNNYSSGSFLDGERELSVPLACWGDLSNAGRRLDGI